MLACIMGYMTRILVALVGLLMAALLVGPPLAMFWHDLAQTLDAFETTVTQAGATR
jgi:hypothetical protein